MMFVMFVIYRFWIMQYTYIYLLNLMRYRILSDNLLIKHINGSQHVHVNSFYRIIYATFKTEHRITKNNIIINSTASPITELDLIFEIKHCSFDRLELIAKTQMFGL